MRTAVYVSIAVVVAAVCGAYVFGGDTNPPAGPVAGTMKTLQQVEPRTPIESLPYTITQSGSYYFTGNLSTASFGIRVDASDVTIDMMGFTMTGSGASPQFTGVEFDAFLHENCTLRNGTIRSFYSGVFADASSTGNSYSVIGVNVLDIGWTGIDLRTSNNLVLDCSATYSPTYDNPNGTTGISVSGGVIKNCRADGFDKGLQGVGGAVISDSVATGCDVGIVIFDGLVNGCAAYGNTSLNILPLTPSTVVNTHQ